MKKKILLVTLFDDHNIGNRLQNFALQKILKKYNTEVTTLDNYYTTAPRIKERFFEKVNEFTKGLGIKKYQKQHQRFIALDALRKANIEFDKKNIGHVIKIKNSKTFEKKWEDYDLAIAGSDQIWHSWRSDPYELPFYYLQFMPHEKRAAYAASFGFEEFPVKDIAQHREGLLGMNYISCREQSGCNLVKNLVGRDSIRVLDPTLLLSAEEWRDTSEQAKEYVRHLDKYIFIYFLGDMTPEYQEYISTVAKKNNIETIINFSDYEDKNISSSGPAEFLYLIDHAEYVFTDSFHCTVFSVLFDKNFKVFKRVQSGFEKMFGRIEDLLASVDKLEAIYGGTTKKSTKDFDELYKKSMKYVEQILEIRG